MEPSLARLAHKLISSNSRILPTTKRIRALFDNTFVFDSVKAKYVWEIPNYPQLYFPKDGITNKARLERADAVQGTQDKVFFGKLSTEFRSTDRLLIFGDDAGPLSGLVKLDWRAMDQWFEEMYPMIIHPRDPYTRVDILPTDRKIRVEVGGKIIADCQAGIMSLWETNLPVRWYLPKTTLNWQYITKSDSQTGCPYKGWASYYNVVVEGREYKDLIWSYPMPLVECSAINQMVCFYNSRVDLFIDGVRENSMT